MIYSPKIISSKVIKEYHPLEGIVGKHSYEEQNNCLFVLLMT